MTDLCIYHIFIIVLECTPIYERSLCPIMKAIASYTHHSQKGRRVGIRPTG